MAVSRHCVDCRADISYRGNVATRCERCQAIYRRTYKRNWQKRSHASPYPAIKKDPAAVEGTALGIFLLSFVNDHVKLRAKTLGIETQGELLSLLTPMQRVIIDLKYEEGMTSFEIANFLRRTEGYVSQELGKAKVKIAEATRARRGEQVIAEGRYSY